MRMVVISFEGSTWKPRRRLLTPAFHFKILDDFIDVFNAQSKVMCDLLDELCKPEDENKRLIDVYPMLTRCTLDIICGKIDCFVLATSVVL